MRVLQLAAAGVLLCRLFALLQESLVFGVKREQFLLLFIGDEALSHSGRMSYLAGYRHHDLPGEL